MSKKFTKTILSSAIAGLLLVSGGVLAEDIKIGNNYIIRISDNDGSALLLDGSGKEALPGVGVIINTKTGTITTVNKTELAQKIQNGGGADPQRIMESVRYTIDVPSLKKENLKKLTSDSLDKIKSNVDAVAKTITSDTAPAYNTAIRNGMSSEAALAVAKDGNGAVLKEFNRIDSKIVTDTTFAIDADGNITLDEAAGTGERYGVKDVVAEVVEDTTVRVAEDGSLTTARNTQTTKRVNEAVVDLDKSVRTNSQDIATNRKAIQSNSRQLQEHNARLNDHQRQIRENHEEMKRAAAQSAALAGLFQPYSVGKFNATAALGGYSDKQAVAVGVGYRFNEQTAAKAGIAASDGDVSYNVGVNFEF
ncbi:YadA-like family protein [Escherichia coli]|nr:YadA-like family protein [Escherichia coli]EHL5742538.1 YadA-like family protein [Escherichia coli]